MFTKCLLFLAGGTLATQATAQFHPAAGTPGSHAMHADSSAFVGWATGCSVTRGYLDITDPALGVASYGTDVSAVGQADGLDVVSLGDAGTAVLTFAQPITDEPGPDFAVFENAFNDHFLELAFVEVSSDGVNYFRFPATSNTQTANQIGPFDDSTEPSELNNLAGKYRGGYGTPFDLAELDGIAGLDIHAVTHVRIVDAIGSIDPNVASRDHADHPVNDPFPTPFPSCGFDLDAVGVIHQLPAGIAPVADPAFVLFPNPVQSGQSLCIQSKEPIMAIGVFTIHGELICRTTADALASLRLSSGSYLIRIETSSMHHMQRLLVTD